MATDLNGQDSVLLRTLLHDLGENPELFDVPGLLRRVVDLVPCDYSSASEIDELHGRSSSQYLPGDATSIADYAAFQWHVHQHPMLRRVRVTGDGGPWRLSDVVSRPDWHGLGLYNEFFRQMRVEHQAAFTVGDARAPAAAAIAFNRSGRDFDDRDMAVLVAVRPLFQLVHRFAGQRRRAAAAELGSRGAPCGVAVLGPAGHVEWVNARATRAVRLALGARLELGALLPERLLDWLSGDAAALRVGSGEAEPLIVRRGPRAHDRRTVLFEIEQRLTSVKLTDRENDVLARMAAGATNQEIADALGISARTVEKHLEHAYVKLGVTNRTAAGVAWRGLRPQPPSSSTTLTSPSRRSSAEA